MLSRLFISVLLQAYARVSSPATSGGGAHFDEKWAFGMFDGRSNGRSNGRNDARVAYENNGIDWSARMPALENFFLSSRGLSRLHRESSFFTRYRDCVR